MRPFWFSPAWLFTYGTHYGCQSSNVERLAQQSHLRSRWDRSPRKPDHRCASSFACTQIGASAERVREIKVRRAYLGGGRGDKNKTKEMERKMGDHENKFRRNNGISS